MCDDVGFNALNQLRAELATTGRTSRRALVVMAGEGTTATRSLAVVLRQHLQLRTLHWITAGNEQVIRTVRVGDADSWAELQPHTARTHARMHAHVVT